MNAQTYGQLKMLLSKAHPGVDTELVDNWIQTRYSDRILSGLSWKRSEGVSVLQSPASVTAGTVAVTQGSNAVTGTGTAFTTAMTGLMIRIAEGQEYYQFAYLSATTGTLDRAYEGGDQTAAAYRIDQGVFLLPSNCRIVTGVFPMHNRRQALRRVTPAELNRMAPQRTTYGTPEYWAQTWDNQSVPPLMQIEFYPIPASPDGTGNTLSHVVEYVFDPAALDPTISSTSLLPWMSSGAMYNGVCADICLYRAGQKEGSQLYLPNAVMLAQSYEAQFNSYLKSMAIVNAQQRGQARMRLSEEFAGNPTRGPFRRRHWDDDVGMNVTEGMTG